MRRIIILAGAVAMLAACAVAAKTPAQQVFEVEGYYDAAQKAILAYETLPGASQTVVNRIHDLNQAAHDALVPARAAAQKGDDVTSAALLPAFQDAQQALEKYLLAQHVLSAPLATLATASPTTTTPTAQVTP